jgi:sugar lactone lactonase YvrE
MKTGFHLFDSASGALTFQHHPKPGTPTNPLNDGKVPPDGQTSLTSILLYVMMESALFGSHSE